MLAAHGGMAGTKRWMLVFNKTPKMHGVLAMSLSARGGAIH